ncbi:S-layer homology domain-containing protein [Egicoccus halophilus]|uniref:SLH domain-containing protein n=1 Tax=Egicoccus halophilus TaxID=1670830 RepID=A0A8J3AA08_9ACTN|nr:N-acetylmuramoyl-L-alanine amidase [Egicoccus halophilus]GGI05939.1 hypothetical protein GCM10011354_16610 [Egicoccus halophilus]
MRSLFARALLVAMALAIAPPASQVDVVAIPEVVSEDLAVRVPTDRLSLASTGQDVPDAHRSDPIAAPIPFSMVGFRLPDGVDSVRVRTAGDDGNWDEWYELERIDEEDGPDAGTAEAANDRSQRYTDPVFVGEATRFQVEIPGQELVGLDAGELEVAATVLDTDGLSGGPVARRAVTVDGPVAEAATAPRVVTRSQWGARAYRGAPSFQDNVDLVVVHHTAGSNNYTKAQAAGIVRGIQSWHMDSNGWADIGYNVLVDRFGTIYEGREGGLTRGVVGAHAAGYNSGSFGISVMGNFVSVDAPQAAYEALADTIAWKAALHGFDPQGTTNRTYRGARVRTVTGHRDVGTTSCPGRISDRLWWLRDQAAKRSTTTPATGPAGGSTSAARFVDVTASAHHHDSIVTVHETRALLGFQVAGTDQWEFRPNQALNRGDMARAVAVGMGLEPKWNDWQGRFPDVNSSQAYWLGPYIAALVDAGIIQGYPDGTFRPGEPLRRDQMATFLHKAMNLRDARPTFVDVPAGSTHYWAIGAVQREGITMGVSPTEYGPTQTMRRDQSATLVVRAFDLQAR